MPSDTAASSINPVISEMHTQNDRGAAICGAAFLEEKLQSAIETDWPPISNTMRARLFAGYGPLSTLAAKIEIARAMGLISSDDRLDFLLIKKIRNEAAHTGLPFRFDDQIIIDVVAKLRCLTPVEFDKHYESDARNAYTGAVKILFGKLWLFTNMPATKRKPRFPLP